MAPILIHGLRLFLFILQEVHCFKHDDALYPQENYITVLRFMFKCVTISDLLLFKWKKCRKMNNIQNRLVNLTPLYTIL